MKVKCKDIALCGNLLSLNKIYAVKEEIMAHGDRFVLIKDDFGKETYFLKSRFEILQSKDFRSRIV